METLIGIYILICVLACWIGISFYGLWYARKEWPALFYQKGKGMITRLRVREEMTEESDASSSRIHQVLNLKYRFEVEGKRYVGEADGGAFEYEKSASGARRPLYKGKYGEGSAIAVWYDPKDPNKNTHFRFGFVSGLVIVGLGQLFLALAIHLLRD